MYKSWMVKSIVLITYIVLVFAVGQASAQTYSGQAYALSVKETVVGQPVLATSVADTGDLPAAGGNITLSSVGVSLLSGAVTVGDSTTSTSGGGNSSQSASSVNSINIGLLGNVITAGEVSSNTSATCPGESLSAVSSIASLTINGGSVTILGTPNQVVQISLGGNPVGTLIINEEIISPRSITRNALHLVVTDPITLTETEVIVSSARSGINCTIAPLLDLYSGRGTAVRVTEDDRLLTGHITTLISDTGWLPSNGGSITTTTAGAGVLGLLSTGVATANSNGGSPVGTSASSSRVDNLDVDLLGAVLITADVLESNTFCSCSLSVGSCGGNSIITNLNVTVLGLNFPVTITGAPNQVVNIPVLGLGNVTLTINEQFGSSSGNPADFNVNALRVDTSLLGLVSTQIVTASSHSDILCSFDPTSASSSVSGQVVDRDDRGIGRVSLRMTSADGEVFSTLSNGFGYFAIDGLRAGETYILEASSKSYAFDPMTITLHEDISGLIVRPSVFGRR